MEFLFAFLFSILFIMAFISKLNSVKKDTPKFVPQDSIYIIDRNTHYYKTLTAGKRIILGRNDTITSRISKAPISRTLSNLFETEDGCVVSANIICTYSSNDILNTQDLLKSVRRSIDDIILSSLYFAVGSIKAKEISTLLNDSIKTNLSKELASLDIKLLSFKTSFELVKGTLSEYCFKPHINGCYHDSIESKDFFKDGPIRYK